MSGKTYFFFAGVLTAAVIPILLNYKRQEKMFGEDDLSSEGNEFLNDAGKYLKKARAEAEKMINEAEAESTTILDHASKTLSAAKEKTAKIHEIISKGSKEEILKMKEELDLEIKKFKDLLN